MGENHSGAYLNNTTLRRAITQLHSIPLYIIHRSTFYPSFVTMKNALNQKIKILTTFLFQFYEIHIKINH